MSDILLTDQLPSTYLILDDQGVQEKFMAEVYQPVFDQLVNNIKSFVDVYDIDKCDTQYLILHAWELGWKLDPTLPVSYMRKITSMLVALYQQKGTRTGIINAMRLFLGLEVNVFANNTDGWQLGVSQLGVNTALSPDPTDVQSIYKFDVVFPRTLTTTERSVVTSLINFMKYSYEIASIVEPSTPEVFWSLGVAQLGVDTKLSA